jgi:hypothetical protein
MAETKLTEATDAMVEAYKYAFGDYIEKVMCKHVIPPTGDIGFHATKYALSYVLSSGREALRQAQEQG